MPKTMHILNGDSTLDQLTKAGIEGECIVWREMLVEGPVLTEIEGPLFWEKRLDFFKNTLGINAADYQIKVIDEIQKIQHIKEHEIICWFEYDLFCQINLIGLCALLFKQYSSRTTYSLICTGYVEGYKGLTPLGHIAPKDFPGLLAQQEPLGYADLQLANTLWNCYVDRDYDAMIKMAENSVFTYLPKAIIQLQKTIPGPYGLNEIDLKLLSLLDEGLVQKQSIIRAMLIWQHTATVYGFGDVQYQRALENLSDYYQVRNGQYQLNQKGKTIYDELTS